MRRPVGQQLLCHLSDPPGLSDGFVYVLSARFIFLITSLAPEHFKVHNFLRFNKEKHF